MSKIDFYNPAAMFALGAVFLVIDNTMTGIIPFTLGRIGTVLLPAAIIIGIVRAFRKSRTEKSV